MKVVYSFLLFFLLVGCTHSTGLESLVSVENIDSDTIVNYSFKNQSEKTISVLGGAKYSLLQNKVIIEEGSVPTKDYIDLAVGEEYKNSITFKSLQPGSYTIQVEWYKTTSFADFTVR